MEEIPRIKTKKLLPTDHLSQMSNSDLLLTLIESLTLPSPGKHSQNRQQGVFLLLLMNWWGEKHTINNINAPSMLVGWYRCAYSDKSSRDEDFSDILGRVIRAILGGLYLPRSVPSIYCFVWGMLESIAIQSYWQNFGMMRTSPPPGRTGNEIYEKFWF